MDERMTTLTEYIKRPLRKLKGFGVRKIITHNFSSEFIANDFGFNRGSPVDRFYIDQFFIKNRYIVTGTCLEFGDTQYIDKYGSNVSKKITFNYSDVSSIDGDKLEGDISNIDSLPSDVVDCIVCVNVLNFVYDSRAAFLGLRKLLKKGGHIVLSVAGPTAHISRYDMDRWGDYWRMTDKSIIKLADDAGFHVVDAETFGNPYSCSAQLNGLSAEDLSEEELIPMHPDYQLVVALVLRKKEDI